MDREKVIKGLKCHMADPDGSLDCIECPYSQRSGTYIDNSAGCLNRLHADALALLKEQGGLVLALEQSNAVNEYLNAEIERLNGLMKEQDSEKERIMKVIWDALHEGFSIDTIADQDWVYEQIRHRIEDI